MRQAWEDCVRSWPILAAMAAIALFGGRWAIGVDRFVAGHELLIEMEKAKFLVVLNENHMSRELLDAKFEAVQTELKRLADQIEKLRNGE